MRKEVILGMSIGGILLAIVVVYLTVTPSHRVKSAVQLDAGNGAGDVQGSGAGDTDPSPGNERASDRASDGSAPTPNRLAGHSNSDATGSVDGAPTRFVGDTARAAGATVDSIENDRKDPVWGKRLYGGTPLIGIAVTPGGNESTAGGDQPDNIRSGGSPAVGQIAMANEIRPAPGDLSTGSLGHAVTGVAAGAPSTRPAAAAGMRQHKVQPGESFSTIAAAAYGSAIYYPHIQRANPGIDARKLRPGMMLNLPDISQVKPVEASTGEPMTLAAITPLTPGNSAGSPPAAKRSPAAIDGKKEYRVQSGDNLHRISIKCYGKISMVGAIYEANKQLIGPDMAKLKLGMVLKLPAPPVAATPR